MRAAIEGCRAAALALLGCGACLAAPANGAPGLIERTAAGPLVCAHRGWLSPEEPENSLATFRHTERAGRFMLEMDLAESKDRQIVLMHDASVERTTTGHGEVAELQAATIDGLRLRTRSGRVLQEAPPRFRAVLDWAAREPRVLLMLDLKRTPPEDAMRLVRAAGLVGRVLLLTFDPVTAARAFAADPDVAVSVLVTNTAMLERYRRSAGTDRRLVAYIPAGNGASLFDAAHRAGVPVATDLLDPTDALQPGRDPAILAGKHVDIVVSNRPQATRRALYGRAAVPDPDGGGNGGL